MGGSGNESLCAFYEYHRYEQEKNQRTRTIQITVHFHQKFSLLPLT